MRTRVAVPALLMLAASLSLAAADAPATPGVRLGAPAPAFTLNDQTGKPVSLADYSGKVVVLTWLNRDCPFVQRHLKANTFTALADKYKDKDVVFLGVDSTHNHTIAGNLKTVTEFGLPFPLLDDAKGAVGHLYNAKTTPDMFIVNKDGTLAYSGAIDNDPAGDASPKVNYVQKALDEILAGKTVSTAETKSYGCSVKYAE